MKNIFTAYFYVRKSGGINTKMVDLNIELPDGFLDEEVRCGYTVTSKMKEVWAVELDITDENHRSLMKI